MLAIPNRLPRGLALRTPQRPRIHLDIESAYRKLAFSEPILGNAEEVLLGFYGNPVLARMLTLAPMKTGSAPQESSRRDGSTGPQLRGQEINWGGALPSPPRFPQPHQGPRTPVQHRAAFPPCRD